MQHPLSLFSSLKTSPDFSFKRARASRTCLLAFFIRLVSRYSFDGFVTSLPLSVGLVSEAVLDGKVRTSRFVTNKCVHGLLGQQCIAFYKCGSI